MGSALGAAGSSRAWRRIREQVLAEEPCCRWCGEPSTTVDHIVPRVAGGDDRRENLAGSCRVCNLARGAGSSVRPTPPSRRW